MKTLIPVCLMLSLLAGGAFAQEREAPPVQREFVSFDDAKTAADKSKRGIFLILYALVPGDKTNARMQFTAAINEAGECNTMAGNFELATMNCFDLGYKTNQCVNPKMAAEYGWPCTVSLYAPGATKHMWRKELSHDDTSGRKEHSKEEIQAALKEAADIYVEFTKTLADLDAKVKANKELKVDIDTQIAYAEGWAKGLIAAKARTHFDEALKLIKKADKTDARIETLSLRAAEVEYAGAAWEDAEKSFNAFAKTFKDSDKAWHAKIMAAKALAMGGDKDGGKEALEKIAKDKKAPAEAKTEAEDAIKEINSEGR